MAARYGSTDKRRACSRFGGLGLLAVGLLLLGWMPPGRAQAPHYMCVYDRSLRDILLRRWAPYEFPIKVYLPAPPAGLVPDPQLQLRAVTEAFRRWNAAWPYLRFRFVDKPSADGIQVIWFNHIFHKNEGRWGEAYLPVDFRGPDKRVLHWSKIHLSVRAHPGSAYGNQGPVLLSEREMRDLAIHEIGHALGLNHSDDGNDVMGGGNYYLITEFDMRNISPRDVASLKLLYGLSYSTREHPCKETPG